MLVGEPDVEDTIAILRGLKERYEVHHGVRIQDAALVAAAVLSDRYITDRFLPDKAIDLMDEAASRLRIEIDTMPTEIDEVERRIKQLEIERQALKKEKDKASLERLEKLEAELADLSERASEMKAHWQAEKEAIDRIRELKEQLEQARYEENKAERLGDLEKAARLRYSEIVGMERRLEEENDQAGLAPEGKSHAQGRGGRRGRGRGYIRLDGHPRGQAAGRRGGEAHPYGGAPAPAGGGPGGGAGGGLQRYPPRPGRPAGSQPPHRVVHVPGPHRRGQDRTGACPGRVPLRRRAGHGPPGHERVHGAPHRQPPGRRTPGLCRLRRRGQLTEAVRRQPYAVVLLDEIEKAHSDVFNVLLQILDDGRLTDGHGRTVDFKNAVIIMTSNVGSQYLQDLAGKEPEEVRDMVMEALRASFRPEFLNRLDEVIIFNQLGLEEIKRIVDIQVEYLRARLADRKLDIRLSDRAKEVIASEGFDPDYGARPLKRVIQREVQDRLARRLLEGEFGEGDTVSVDVDPDGTFTFTRA